MLLKMFFKILPLIALGSLLSGCPTGTGNSGIRKQDLTFGGMRSNLLASGDRQAVAALDNSCPAGSSKACESGVIDPARIARGATAAPNKCDDGNRTHRHLDTTKSLPGVKDHTQISNAATWSAARMQKMFNVEASIDGTGNCAYGVRKMLHAAGVPGFSYGQGDAHAYLGLLKGRDDFVPLDTSVYKQAADCPVGAVATYSESKERPCKEQRPWKDNYGKTRKCTGGDRVGHVEVVLERNGKKAFCSDYCGRPGGTVPKEFTGCFVFTGSFTK